MVKPRVVSYDELVLRGSWKGSRPVYVRYFDRFSIKPWVVTSQWFDHRYLNLCIYKCQEMSAPRVTSPYINTGLVRY